MPRFYVDPSQVGPDHIVLTGGEYNHVKNVLRKQVGDTLLRDFFLKFCYNYILSYEEE